jgi:hypothetical protein
MSPVVIGLMILGGSIVFILGVLFIMGHTEVARLLLADLKS